MRQIVQDPESAREVGRKARAHVVAHYSADVVGHLYAERLAAIQAKLRERKEDQGKHGEELLAKFDRKWSLSSQFKSCAVLEPPMPAASLTVLDKGAAGARAACKIAIVSTYPPRECGIATFADKLRQGLLEACGEAAQVHLVIVKHQDQDINEYDRSIVVKSFNEYEVAHYEEAARFINDEGYGVTLLQYEFGIYPGSPIVCFAKEIRGRLITVVHTVSRVYEEEHHAAVQQLAVMSHKLVVMTETMRWTLDSFHAISPDRVAVIPHGVPPLELNRTQGTAQQPMFPGRRIVMSNGLLHAGKGIEYMLQAMPAVIEAFPDVIYVIQGKPHPTGWMVKEYYEMLHETVNSLGLQDHVHFYETFLATDELLALLRGATIYVNPYVDHTQSVSGTLAMALSTGAACISTPYPYAEELLRRSDAGMLVSQSC